MDASVGHTGYTHQWKNSAFSQYKQYLMASVDTLDEYKLAKSKGWRTFRISPSWIKKDSGEMPCLNAIDGKTCMECLQCSGNSKQDKDIYVKVHGPTWKVNNFITQFGDGADGGTPLTREDKRIINDIEKHAISSKVDKSVESPLSDIEKLSAAMKRKRLMS